MGGGKAVGMGSVEVSWWMYADTNLDYVEFTKIFVSMFGIEHATCRSKR